MLIFSNIQYKKELYLIRKIELDEFGTVLISTSTLNDRLLTTNGAYSSKAAQFIDEKIFYFVDDDKMYLCEDKLKSLILGEIL